MLEVAGCQAGGPRTLSSPIDTGLALITPTDRLVKKSIWSSRQRSTRVHLQYVRMVSMVLGGRREMSL